MNNTQSAFDSEFLKKLEYLYIVSKKIFAGRIKAERRSTRRGVSVEFADYRNYTAGDDFRYIDWNAFARLDELLLKLYEEREDLHIYFLVDTSQSMTYGEPQKLLYAKRVAAGTCLYQSIQLRPCQYYRFHRSRSESVADRAWERENLHGA